MSRHHERQQAHLRLVRLEDRTTPATLVWTGDVGTNWGTNQLGNTNWAFDLLPHNGDSLVFPASSQNHSNSNNLTGLVINNITVQYSVADFGGNAITLTGNFVDSSASSNSENDFTMPMVLSVGAHTFTISSSSTSSPNADGFGLLSESGGSASVVKEGAGLLVYHSSNSYTGPTTVNAGELALLNSSGTSIGGDLLIKNGFVREELVGNLIADTASVTVNSGGMIDLNGHFDIIGALHVASGGRLNLRGNSQGNLNTSSLSLDSGSTLSLQVGRSATLGDDVLLSTGPVHLGGTLDLLIGSLDPIGHAFIVTFNFGSNPVTGTFDNLPQGAIVDNAGRLHTINYSGGDGNDVELTRRANVEVTSTRINDGAAQRSRVTSLTVTFTDPVTFSITPGTAFTLVRNTDGAIVQFNATATLVNGVTVVTLDNFGGNASQFGSLADGRYTLTALASQISSFGEPLDGNADGTAGDNYTLNDTAGLFCLFGDVNGDQNVNGLDLGFFRNAFGTQIGDPNYLSFLDFNGDGVINGFDLGQFRTRFGTVLP